MGTLKRNKVTAPGSANSTAVLTVGTSAYYSLQSDHLSGYFSSKIMLSFSCFLFGTSYSACQHFVFSLSKE
jgi:hypothetical protein